MAIKTKKIFKIILGVIIFFTLPSLLFFGFVYFKYAEDLPQINPTEKADILANKMLEALDYEAYKNTDYIEFTFKQRHKYQWNKLENTCNVFWSHFRVELDLNNKSNSKVFVQDQAYNGVEKEKYVQKAIDYFNNDTFWLVAPYKVFDAGTKRSIAKNEDGEEGLLVTYTKGGSTPGDSYLWHLDENYKPKSFQMWVDILPIGGLEATWSDWKTTETNAQLPTFHKFMFLGLELDDIKTKIDTSKVYYPSKDFFEKNKNYNVINLDSLKSIDNLYERIDEIRLKDNYAILNFNLNNKEYFFSNFQEYRGTIDDYRCNDVLRIFNEKVYQCDSIIEVSSKCFSKKLEKFLVEKDNLNRILISQTKDDSISNTKKLMVKINEVYKKIKTENKSSNIFDIRLVNHKY